MEMHAHVPKIGKTLGHWLLEGLFIVISVALGFWVTQVREERQSHELAARVLTGLQAEVQHNLATLEPFIDIQQKWLDAMGKFGSSHRSSNRLPRLPDVLDGMWHVLRHPSGSGEYQNQFPDLPPGRVGHGAFDRGAAARGLRSRCRTVRDLPDAGSLQEQPGQGRPFFDGLVRPGRSRCGSSQDCTWQWSKCYTTSVSSCFRYIANTCPSSPPRLAKAECSRSARCRTSTGSSWRVHCGAHACRNRAAGVAAPTRL